jgi:hypothetical protein
MIAEKIKEVFERDYLPIIREICDEVEVRISSHTIPLSKRGNIEAIVQVFHCYDRDEEKENCFWWKGAVTIWQRKRIVDGVVRMEAGELHVEGILGFLYIYTWDEDAERKVRRRLNFFVSHVLAETIARRLGLKSKKNEIYLEDGRKVKVKFSPQETSLALEGKPKKVTLRNLSGAELLKALTQTVSFLLL